MLTASAKKKWKMLADNCILPFIPTENTITWTWWSAFVNLIAFSLVQLCGRPAESQEEQATPHHQRFKVSRVQTQGCRHSHLNRATFAHQEYKLPQQQSVCLSPPQKDHHSSVLLPWWQVLGHRRGECLPPIPFPLCLHCYLGSTWTEHLDVSLFASGHHANLFWFHSQCLYQIHVTIGSMYWYPYTTISWIYSIWNLNLWFICWINPPQPIKAYEGFVCLSGRTDHGYHDSRDQSRQHEIPWW